MSVYGLQLFDSSGNIILTTADRFTRYTNSYHFRLSFMEEGSKGNFYEYVEKDQGYSLTKITVNIAAEGIRDDGRWGCILTNVQEYWNGSNPLFIYNTIINPIILVDIIQIEWYIAWKEAMPIVTGDLMVVRY